MQTTYWLVLYWRLGAEVSFSVGCAFFRGGYHHWLLQIMPRRYRLTAPRLLLVVGAALWLVVFVFGVAAKDNSAVGREGLVESADAALSLDAETAKIIAGNEENHRDLRRGSDDDDDDDDDDDKVEESDDDEEDDDEEEREDRLEDFEDTAWVVHGLLMATSWGLLAPLAIGSSLLRSLVGPMWFKIHQYFQMTVLCFTSIAFGLAVINVHLDEGEHFDETHKRVGLSIFILLLLQVASGLFRPHLPAAPPVTQASGPAPSEGQCEPEHASSIDRGAVESSSSRGEIVEDDHDDPAIERRVETASSQSTRDEKVDIPKKSPQRWFFEIQHRVLGALLVGLAWFNCTTGINEEFEETSALLVFWIVVGTICFGVLSLRLLVQLKIFG